MTEMRNCVEKLASEINARPAGTDEEQTAAIFISDEFQSKTNMDVEMEEFQTSFLGEMFRSISAGCVFLAGLVAIVFPPSLIGALVLGAIGAVLFILDNLSIFKLSSLVGKSPTQNVVAKYVPASDAGNKRRSRKIVLITNYDSERMRPEVASSFYRHLGKIKIAELVCVALVFLVLLLTLLFGSNLFFTFVLVIGCIGSVLPLLSYIFHATAQYNEGANNNAASVAVMLDVAKRISSGVFVPSGDAPVIHGQDIAEREGVIPYETEVEWQSDSTEQISTPLQEEVFTDVETETPAIDDLESQVQIEQYQPIQENPAPSGPDWFNRGKAKANGGQMSSAPSSGVKRSAFGDALEAASHSTVQSDRSGAISDNRADEPKSDIEKQLAAIHDQIEKASSEATARTKEDVEVAEKVLENEIGEAERESAERQEAKNEVASAIPVIAAEREPEITLRPAKDEESRAGVTGYLEAVTETSDYEATVVMDPVPVKNDEEKQKRASVQAPSRSAIDDRLAARNAVEETQKPVERVKRDIQLPSLTGAIEAQKKEKKSKEEADKEKSRIKERDEKLGITVPSLDSTNSEDKKMHKNTKVAQAGAFGVGEATGTFEPITDDLVAGLSDEETYVLDADDTIYEEQTTESGAVAGPGYVEIPETRTESVFGKIFNRKKKKSEQEMSFREAYNVDEDFDAREVGKKRGDWESFAPDNDEWNGGMAISAPDDEMQDLGKTRDDIFAFAQAQFDHEVWCVALGADYADHAGAKKFFEMHKDELKGSIFIVLDGLGAGVTTLVEKEGVLKSKSISPRMKRIARGSAKTVGLDLASTTMTWTDSLAAVVANNGFSFIHVAGCEDGKPAMLSHKDDSAEFVEDEAMSENANYIMELVRSI